MSMRTVLFDFDGLIADTEPAHMQAYDDVFSLLGIPAQSKPAEWVGRSTRDILQEVIRETGTTIPLERIRAEKRALLLKRLQESPLMPHVSGVLRRFQRVATLGIVTSSTSAEIEPILSRHGLSPFFSFKVCFDEVAQVKPSAEPYLKALQVAGVDAKDAWALEDSSKGVQSAQKAGIRCVAVPNAFTRPQDFSRADYVAQDLQDAEAFIRSDWGLASEASDA